MSRVKTADIGDRTGACAEFNQRAQTLIEDQATLKTLLEQPIADDGAIKDTLYEIECAAYRMRMITTNWMFESGKFKLETLPAVSHGGQA